MLPTVRLSLAEAERLRRFYADGEREILDAVSRSLTSRSADHTVLKAAVGATLAALLLGARQWADEAIPRMYQAGVDSVDATLGTSGALTAVHKLAVDTLRDAAYDRLANVATIVESNVNQSIQQIVLDSVRGSITGTDTWKQAAADIRQGFEDNGVTGFVDAAGRNWNMTTYSEMAARSATMQAQLEGTSNRIVENTGGDLAEIIGPTDSSDGCEDVVGMVVSIYGQDSNYPSLDEVEANSVIFHPQCRHDLGAYVPEDSTTAG